MLDLIGNAQRLYDVLMTVDETVDANLPAEIAEIVKFHSKGAAASAVASGWVPGAGSTIAVTISAGFIWTMYGKINAEINMPISENILKSIATGVATNLAAYFAGGLIMSTAFSLFPGVGSLGAAAIIGGTCYGLTLLSGAIYLKILADVISQGLDPSNMSEQELKSRADETIRNEDMNEAVKRAKSEYKKDK